MRYFDASAWVGAWPFRPSAARTPAALERLLRAQGVTGACAAPLEAVLAPDPMPANVAFLRAVARSRAAGGFCWVPAAVVDPTLDGWEDGARRCLSLGARCLKVLPNYHLYSAGVPAAAAAVPWVPRAAEAGRRGLEALCAMAAAAGVPVAVQLRLQDERAQHPLLQVPGVPAPEVAALALRHPGTRFLACGAYLAELPALAPPANLAVELSFVEGEDTLAQALATVAAPRVLVGTHAPLFYVRAGIAKVDAAAAVAPEVRAAVASANAEALWGRP
jgi:hypothetical protein